MKKERLDVLLVKKGLASSREKAKAIIMSGIVFVDGQREDKAGSTFDEKQEIIVKGKTLKYVSRGGLKLEKAMKNFDIVLKDKVCMEPVIRIRRMNKQYFLTFKSKGLMARTEHEFPLDKAAYEHLLPKVDGILISKTRYKIPDEHGFVIELDVFHGEYEGLVMAEVEFPSEEVAVEYEGPEWFDDEVTFDSRYQNNNLANK